MRSISPIVSKVTDIIIIELALQHYNNQRIDSFIINIKDNYDLSDFGIDEILIVKSNHNSYDHMMSGFNNETGKYTAIIKLNIENLFLESILHEVKHAYVDWKIYHNGGTPIKYTREVKRFYTDELERFLIYDRDKFPNLIKIIELYYYSSPLEVPSFLENHNQNPNYIKYHEKVDLMLDIDLIEFNIDELKTEFIKFKEYDIPYFRRFQSFSDFINGSKVILSKRGKKILKKIKRIEKC